MKVLFLKDVGGVGQRGTIKDVSDGYALNALIPKGLAVQATPDKIAAHKKQEELNKRASGERTQKIAESLSQMNGRRFVMKVKQISTDISSKVLKGRCRKGTQDRRRPLMARCRHAQRDF